MKITDISYFGSHVPILVKILERTDGKILDLGMGLSTVIMHMMARKTKRMIFSYESDREWFKKYRHYRCDFHRIKFVEDWDKIDIDNDHWSVALIDHHPPKRRKEEVKRLANIADYILLHDSDIFRGHYKWNHVFSWFKYRYEYKKCFPNTVVFSNLIDLSDL